MGLIGKEKRDDKIFYVYEVDPGNTFSKICAQFGYGYNEIESIYNLAINTQFREISKSIHVIFPHTICYIPEKQQNTEQKSDDGGEQGIVAKNSKLYYKYKVKSDDTFSRICEKYGYGYNEITKIYKLDINSEFRRKSKSIDLIFPNTICFIPVREVKRHDRNTIIYNRSEVRFISGEWRDQKNSKITQAFFDNKVQIFIKTNGMKDNTTVDIVVYRKLYTTSTTYTTYPTHISTCDKVYKTLKAKVTNNQATVHFDLPSRYSDSLNYDGMDYYFSATAIVDGVKKEYKQKEKDQLNVIMKRFFILSGGPQVFGDVDSTHDIVWYNFVIAILELSKAKLLEKVCKLDTNEDIYWFIYKPAYEKRWASDIKSDREFIQKRVSDIKEVKAEAKSGYPGDANYINHISYRVAGYNEKYHIKLIWIRSSSEFWSFMKYSPDGSINRVWYFGHSEPHRLMLVLRNTGLFGDYEDSEIIKIKDIARNSQIKRKFIPDALHEAQPCKFYGCFTSQFAQEWYKTYIVRVEGSIARVNFDNLQREKNISRETLRKYGKLTKENMLLILQEEAGWKSYP